MFLFCLDRTKKGETQIVVSVVPAQRSDRYSGVKKLCYVELPVPSQVIVTKTISNQQKLTVSFLRSECLPLMLLH